VVVCLELGADLHMARLMPCYSLSVASVKSRLVFLSGTDLPGQCVPSVPLKAFHKEEQSVIYFLWLN